MNNHDIRPRRRRIATVAGALTVALALPAVPAFAAQAVVDPVTPTVAGTGAEEPCAPLTRFRARNFDDSADLDNSHQPLRPGTEITLQAVANTGGALLPHQTVVTATDLVKKIDGVWARVLWQTDWQDDELVSSSLVFQAQDDDGNVWQLGAYPEPAVPELPAGSPGAWIAGVAGARAGIVVPGDPQHDEPPYLRAEAPGIGLLECAVVVRTSADEVCAPVVCYDDVLVVEEFSPLLAPPVRRSYVPGVGLVAAAQANSDGQTLFLSGRRRLPIDERLAADTAAVQLEQRAYATSEVYADTEPMRFRAGDRDARAVQGLLGDRVR